VASELFELSECLQHSIADDPVTPEVARYLSAAISLATRRAYRGDVEDFQISCAGAAI
jgi:hypothetical protein